jgi:hypothetical protein
MEQRFTFRVSALLFLCEDIVADDYEKRSDTIPMYTEADVDKYIAGYKPYERIIVDVANSFDNTLNKCIQSLSYDPASRTITATLQILAQPGVYPLVGETAEDYADDVKDDILTDSFEDGCYGSKDCIFHKDGIPIGVFDIRDRHTLDVELVSVAPGPTQEEYEASWRPSEKEKDKIPYSEAFVDFQKYLSAPTVDERLAFFNTKVMEYFRRGIYGIGRIFQEIYKSPFYTTDEERQVAFRRIWGKQTWAP